MTCFDRRTLLLGGLASAGIAATPMAGEPRGFFARHQLPVGIQLYTVADDAARDLNGTLQRLARIGFRTVELAGYHGHTPRILREAADRAGLRFTSIHLSANTDGLQPGLDADPRRLAADLMIMGIKDVVLPIVPFAGEGPPAPGEDPAAHIARVVSAAGPDIWKRTAALLNKRGAALRREGLHLGYHNHNLEFAPVAGRTGFEIIAAETDPGLVSFEMDAGWVAAAGLDPVALLRRYPGRFRQMHVKDIRASTTRNYRLKQDPVEVGGGMIPWPTLLPAAYAAGIRQYFVEQEPPFTGQRFDAVAKSYAFLTTKV